MLKSRVLAALVFAPALFIILLAGGWPLWAACAGLAALMHGEALRLLTPQAPWPIVAGSWLSAALCFALSVDAVPAELRLLLGSGATVAMLCAALVSRGTWTDRANAAGLSMFAAAYGAGLIGLLVTLRARPNDGVALSLLALFVPWAADTGAYFAGRAFGRHKLAPHISPKKTVEGLIGGVVCALLLALVLSRFWPHVAPTRLLVGSALAAAMGTVGDLSESLLKRGAGAKDSGHLIPGHGGVLDRFDSVLFAAWTLYAVSTLWPDHGI